MSNIVLHIPHSSTDISNLKGVLSGISDADIKSELLKMTDLYTDELFTGGDKLVFPVSRLVCDVERFKRDEDEPMSRLGMGALYTHLSNGKKFRALTNEQRDMLFSKYYDKHHDALTSLVDDKLAEYNSCIIVDCHSFDDSMSYTGVASDDMPDICIGADMFHTPRELVNILVGLCKNWGYSVEVNSPFVGSLVPLKHYKSDLRVSSVMIEINKRLYIDENGNKSHFFKTTQSFCSKLVDSISNYSVTRK